jgi:hypothetical protein
MQKFGLIGLLSVILIAGCTENPGITMKFKDKSETIMLGQLNMRDVNYINKVYFDYEVSDGQTTCSGKTPVVKLQLTSALNNKVQTTMSVDCEDGRKGNLSANMTFNGRTWSGIGVGKLNDGTDVRVVVGDMIGNLDW